MNPVQELAPNRLMVVDQLLQIIFKRRDSIETVLRGIESQQTIEDELFKTIDCLENITTEAPYIENAHVNFIASIPPVNLPLYSLLIFGIVPALMGDRLVLRPPTNMSVVYQQLYKILDLRQILPQLQIIANIERQVFTDTYTTRADVVLFTGTHYNAVKIMKSVRKDALFIYNGAGINPMVVFDNADLDLAVDNAVYTKSFNSGQDCAGPDAILIDEKIADEFIKRLRHKVAQLTIGTNYKDPSVVIGPLIEQTQLAHLTKLLSQNASYIIQGGQIDFKHTVVTPTIIVKPVDHGPNYDELFAPIFFVHTFSTKSFKQYFQTDHYTNFAMYASYFGFNNDLESVVTDTTVLRDTNIIKVERGSTAYGGRGYYASYVQYQKNKICKPILISKEIAAYCEAIAT